MPCWEVGVSLAVERVRGWNGGCGDGEDREVKGRGGEERGGEKELPLLKLLPVRTVFDAAEHEIGKMAVFVRDDVDEPVCFVLFQL